MRVDWPPSWLKQAMLPGLCANPWRLVWNQSPMSPALISFRYGPYSICLTTNLEITLAAILAFDFYTSYQTTLTHPFIEIQIIIWIAHIWVWRILLVSVEKLHWAGFILHIRVARCIHRATAATSGHIRLSRQHLPTAPDFYGCPVRVRLSISWVRLTFSPNRFGEVLWTGVC